MKKVSVLAALFVSTAFLAMPVNAGRLATPILPTFRVFDTWDYLFYVTNLGRHAETYQFQCYDRDGRALITVYDPTLPPVPTASIDPAETNLHYVEAIGRAGNLATVRCEIEVKGSASDWQVILCNYAEKYSGSNNDQCIEGR